MFRSINHHHRNCAHESNAACCSTVDGRLLLQVVVEVGDHLVGGLSSRSVVVGDVVEICFVLKIIRMQGELKRYRRRGPASSWCCRGAVLSTTSSSNLQATPCNRL